MTETSIETRSVVIEREMPYPPEKIWRALTQSALIAEWLMKNDFKPVVDHRFNLRADWGTVRSFQSSRTRRCLTRGRPWVLRVSSLGLSSLRARGPSCAWSIRASGRIRAKPTRAPSSGGRSSSQTWSRSWRGSRNAAQRRPSSMIDSSVTLAVSRSSSVSFVVFHEPRANQPSETRATRMLCW